VEEYERISWSEKRRRIADFKEKQRLERPGHLVSVYLDNRIFHGYQLGHGVLRRQYAASEQALP
jgi:hypothetical protein